MNVIALAFGLGVAGFDVFGAVLVVLLVASKLPKQRIAAFALVVLAGTPSCTSLCVGRRRRCGKCGAAWLGGGSLV